MFLSIFGLFFLWKKDWRLAITIIVFSLINFYIIFSWWCWWYGGSFGARPLIDTYGIYAISMTAFFQFFLSRRLWLKIAFIILAGLFVYHNIFQIRQVQSTIIHWDSMTKEAYWKAFLRVRPPEGYYELLRTPNYDAARKGEEEYRDE